MKNAWDDHKDFITIVYQITLGISFIISIFGWFKTLFNTARDNNFIGFIFTLVFHFLFTSVNALILTAIYGTIAVVILFIPYLIVRGLIKK